MDHEEPRIEVTGACVVPVVVSLAVGVSFLLYQFLRLVGVFP